MPRALLAGLTLLVAAAILFVLLAGYLAWRTRQWRDLDLVLEGDFPIEADAELGFVPVRNGASRRTHPRAGLAYDVYTSDRRARVGRRGKRTPPQVDLLFFGCSFTWGHGVPYEDTYPARVGRALETPTANFAYSAFGTVQSAQILRRSLDLRPRVVVYAFIADHLRRNASPCAPAYGPLCLPVSHVTVDGQGRPALAVPDPALFELNRRFWRDFFFTKGLSPRHLWRAAEVEWAGLARTPRIAAPDTPEVRREALEMLLGRMRDDARSVGARLLVVHIPYLERGTTNPVPAPLREAMATLAGEDVMFLDLAPVVARHYSDVSAPLLRFPRDRHPNPLAHALIADETAGLLRARGLVSPAP